MTSHPILPRLAAAPPAALCARWDTTIWSRRALALGLTALLLGGAWSLAHAADPAAAAKPAVPASASAKTPSKKPVTDTSDPAPLVEKVDLGNDLKKALRAQLTGGKKITLIISDTPRSVPPAGKASAKSPQEKTLPKAAVLATSARENAAKTEASDAAVPALITLSKNEAAVVPAPKPAALARTPRPAATKPSSHAQSSRQYIRSKAAALSGHAPEPQTLRGLAWSYSGQTGPQAWGQLQPEFITCATGKRQTPINIEDSTTLQGPAEPLNFSYQPSNGTVVNDGHSIQVNVQGNNTLTVRGTTYSLVQLQFHSPSEVQVNDRSYAMGVHLMHKSADGQLAVVAVLLDPGQANAMIDTVWTYMPLDVGDEVRMPAGMLNINELLPKDQRYYQFLGSLTTPPCTEDVLWIVLKEPAQISAAQLRLFRQLYPNNARPVQQVNGRPIRSAQ